MKEEDLQSRQEALLQPELIYPVGQEGLLVDNYPGKKWQLLGACVLVTWGSLGSCGGTLMTT